MKPFRVIAVGLTAVVAGTFVACDDDAGFDPPSTFDDHDASDDGGHTTDANNTVVDAGTKGGDLFGNSLAEDGGTCAETTAEAKPIPLYLVFMFDRSGSMNDDNKWTSCKTGLEGFFADPKSAGLSASLQFFPQFYQDDAECLSTSYSTPAVAMVALPLTTSFKTALDAEGPRGGTPTEPAIRGAIAYAQTQAAAYPDGKVAIVLVTDGMPNDCDSTVASVAAAEATVAAQIPTYVIGVGPQAADLDALAQGGNTGTAINVSTADPSKIAGDFQAALQAVRVKALGCDFELPDPPPGQKVDLARVSVRYTDGKGTTTTLPYSKTCQDGKGWRYDDDKSPTKVTLCPNTCTQVRTDQGAKLAVAIACQDIVK